MGTTADKVVNIRITATDDTARGLASAQARFTRFGAASSEFGQRLAGASGRVDQANFAAWRAGIHRAEAADQAAFTQWRQGQVAAQMLAESQARDLRRQRMVRAYGLSLPDYVGGGPITRPGRGGVGGGGGLPGPGGAGGGESGGFLSSLFGVSHGAMLKYGAAGWAVDRALGAGTSALQTYRRTNGDWRAAAYGFLSDLPLIGRGYQFLDEVTGRAREDEEQRYRARQFLEERNLETQARLYKADISDETKEARRMGLLRGSAADRERVAIERDKKLQRAFWASFHQSPQEYLQVQSNIHEQAGLKFAAIDRAVAEQQMDLGLANTATEARLGGRLYEARRRGVWSAESQALRTADPSVAPEIRRKAALEIEEINRDQTKRQRDLTQSARQVELQNDRQFYRARMEALNHAYQEEWKAADVGERGLIERRYVAQKDMLEREERLRKSGLRSELSVSRLTGTHTMRGRFAAQLESIRNSWEQRIERAEKSDQPALREMRDRELSETARSFVYARAQAYAAEPSTFAGGMQLASGYVPTGEFAERANQAEARKMLADQLASLDSIVQQFRDLPEKLAQAIITALPPIVGLN